MPKQVSPHADTAIVDPWSFLEFADRARKAKDRATAEFLIASAYAAYDSIFAAAAPPDALEGDRTPDAAALPPEPRSEAKTMRKFWE